MSSLYANNLNHLLIFTRWFNLLSSFFFSFLILPNKLHIMFTDITYIFDNRVLRQWFVSLRYFPHCAITPMSHSIRDKSQTLLPRSLFNTKRAKRNKAGYTAISCGRVGRGGNARFPTFRLDGYGRTDGPTDRRTDKASYRVACPQLKTSNCT